SSDLSARLQPASRPRERRHLKARGEPRFPPRTLPPMLARVGWGSGVWNLRTQPGLMPAIWVLIGPFVVGEDYSHSRMTDQEGRPDYAALRRRLAAGAVETDAASLAFLAFDALYLRGRSLLRQPLERRRARLSRGVSPGGHLFVPEHIETEGVELFEA